jgi:hypothetical protein
MLKKAKELPTPLRKQVTIRFGAAVCFLFAGILSIMSFKDLSALAACAAREYSFFLKWHIANSPAKTAL